MSDFAGILGVLSALGRADGEINRHFNSVVIVAAGNGTRMGKNHDKTKQMTDLCGIPVAARSIAAFEACAFVNEIVVVARQDEIANYGIFADRYGFKKITAVVPGGSTRQKSALEGIKAISPKSEFVAIHDGARCLVTPEMISEVFAQAYAYGAATAAERSRDTLKKADHSGFISETIDRAYLWHAQTPQIFKTDVYRASAYSAQENGFEATDDCMLAEHIGFRIKLVDCGHENLKITTPDDFYMAEAILRLREDRKARENAEV